MSVEIKELSSKEVRMRCLELVVKHCEATTLNGVKPLPPWVIDRAKEMESYVLSGKRP